MFQEEKEFNLRFSLEANFPEDYEGEEDEYAWLKEWETRVKPELLKTIFDSLRRHPAWIVHVRNRGLSPNDEIEIAMVKDFTKGPPVLRERAWGSSEGPAITAQEVGQPRPSQCGAGRRFLWRAARKVNRKQRHFNQFTSNAAGPCARGLLAEPRHVAVVNFELRDPDRSCGSPPA